MCGYDCFNNSISCFDFTGAAGLPSQNHQPIVGVLPQPSSSGNRQDTSTALISNSNFCSSNKKWKLLLNDLF